MCVLEELVAINLFSSEEWVYPLHEGVRLPETVLLHDLCWRNRFYPHHRLVAEHHPSQDRSDPGDKLRLGFPKAEKKIDLWGSPSPVVSPSCAMWGWVWGYREDGKTLLVFV